MLGKALGEGKFGTVYQAVHKETKFLVALKKITKLSIKSNYMIDQFLL
jgi:serine/threonine protein kinase